MSNTENKIDLWVSDKYYTEHPKKILGEPFTVSKRFGGEATKYKGTRADLAKIDVPKYDVVGVTDNLFLSVENSDTLPTVLARNEAENVERALKAADNERRLMKIAKKAALRQAESGERLTLANKADFFSFEEVDAMYNAAISAEEKQLFVHYQMRVLGRPMRGGWRNYHHKFTTDELIDAGKRGLVAYEVNERGGSFIPMFLYLSGNVFEKLDTLEDTRADIVQAVGDEMCIKQFNALKALCKRMDDARLSLLNPTADKRLRILPTSVFATDYKITATRLDKNFACRMFGIADKYGQPDFEHDEFISTSKSHKNHKTYTQFSLQDAFVFWLIKYQATIAFKKGLNWRDVYRLGVANKQRRGEDEDLFKKRKSFARVEAQRLFSIFLADVVTETDRVEIERAWNRKFNTEVPIDYNRVPIGFPMARTYNGVAMEIKPEKREAIAFAMMQGSGCLAYGVGLGKTWCAAFIFGQFLENGWSQRPMLAVPNQVYKQFKAELNGILPHIYINDFYNLSLSEGYLKQAFNQEVYLAEHKGDKVEVNRIFLTEDETTDTYFFKEWTSEGVEKETFTWTFDKIKKENRVRSTKLGSISIVTYEGFKRLGLSQQETDRDFFYRLAEIFHQQTEKPQTEKDHERFKGKLDGFIGAALRGSVINMDDLGTDMLVIDEAHSLKKVFTQAKGKSKKTGQEYKLSAGNPSAMGIKGFMLSQYIQYKNPTGNVLLLTATPFTNSPLEVFSMLALVAYRELERKRLNNITQFFDNYSNIQRDLVINAALRPVFKEVFLGFENLPALQRLIGRFFLYKRDAPDLIRPNKIILPRRQKMVDGVLVYLSKKEIVDTILPMTPEQEEIMGKIFQFAEGIIEDTKEFQDAAMLDEDEGGEFADDEKVNIKDDDDDAKATAGEVGEVAEKSLNEAEKTKVRLFQSMSFAQSATLSPYMVKNNLPPIDYLNYVKTSAKLDYTMQCIKSVKEYHESRNEPVSGQIIYMNRGVKKFELLKEYLVKVVGFKPHEVGIIRSSMPKGQDKSWVQDRFLGRAYDENTRTFSDISDNERIKVLIGSATIREGLNLQKYGTTLYDLFLDWNPSDFEQLCGRIWRQANLYSNVRIVIPLLADSMDVFMFQKLQEKTARINDLWDFNTNKSGLSVEEFNPAELKYALMKDARRIAEIEIQEKESSLEDEKGLFLAELNTLKEINKHTPAKYQIERVYEHIEHFATPGDKLKPLDYYLTHLDELLRLTHFIRQRKTLKDGLNLVKLRQIELRARESKDTRKYDNIVKGYKTANAVVFKAVQDTLIGRTPSEYEILRLQNEFRDAVQKAKQSVTMNTIDARIAELQGKLDNFNTNLADLKSDDKLNLRAAQIEEDRANSGSQSATVAQCVAQFAKLNYLLSDMRMIQNKAHEPKKATPSVSERNLPTLDVDAEKLLMLAAARKRRIRILKLKNAA